MMVYHVNPVKPCGDRGYVYKSLRGFNSRVSGPTNLLQQVSVVGERQFRGHVEKL